MTRKNVMAARDALVETKSKENSSKIAKTGIRIRARAQDGIEDLLQGSHRGKLLVEFLETATVANLMRSALARDHAAGALRRPLKRPLQRTLRVNISPSLITSRAQAPFRLSDRVALPGFAGRGFFRRGQ